MSKTYTLQATLNTGHLNGSDTMEPNWSNFLAWNDASDNIGYAGYDSPYWRYATNMMFDQATLASLRSKVSNGITVSGLTLTVNCTKDMTGETLIGYKANSTASGNGSSGAWTRCNNDGTAGAGANSVAYQIDAHTLSTGTQTFSLKRTTPYSGIPQYGLVAGPQTNVTGRWRFDSATLYVTTNETDYSYTLAYNVNGGSGTFSNQTGSNTGTSPSYTFTISSTVPTRAGYTFLGWSKSSSATSASYSPGGSITVTSSGTTTLYAVWKIITYTVSYNVNGGSGSFANQTKNYGGSFNIHSTKPTPPSSTSAGSYTVTYNANGGSVSPASASAARTTSYAFSTWNTAQNGSGTSYAAGAPYSANASATLYAQYTSSTTTAYVSLTSNVSRTGYNFNGWYTAASGGTRVGGAGSAYTPTGNVTLYAQWTASSATLSSVTSSVDCGNNLTGSWTSTGNYYYKLKVTCGNATAAWSNVTTQGAQTATVQIPTEWYTMVNGPLKNATSAQATCELYTYSNSGGTTQVGTASSKTFTVNVPSSVAPTLGALTYTSSSDNTVVSGWGSNLFVQGYSKVTLTLSVSSYNGSALKNVHIYGPGLDYSGTSLTSTASSAVNSSGSVRYTAVCTDTRDRWSSTYVDVPFTAYGQPSVSGIAVVRCDSNGTVNNSAGAYFKATPSYSFSAIGNNQLRVQTIQYRVHPNGGWSTATNCVSGSTYGPWSSSLTSAYDVMVTLADEIQYNAGTSYYTHFTTTLPTVQGIWYGKGNDRLGLGGVPEGAGLYCDWDATFKGVVDVVPRRCYATLNQTGWYRILTNSITPRAGQAFDIEFHINTAYYNDTNQSHIITLQAVYDNFKFVNEKSLSNSATIVDKIRCMRTADNMYVDIHYYSTTSNPVSVDFDVHVRHDYKGDFTATNFTAVGPSPSGETEIALYTFAANTVNHSDTTTSGVRTIVDRNGKLVTVTVYAAGGISCASGQYTTVATLPSWAYPRNNVYPTVDAYGGNNIFAALITTSGDVQLYPVLSNTSYYRLTCTYCTA